MGSRMRHTFCNEFYAYWTSCCWGHNLPDISSFTPDKMRQYGGFGVILSLRGGDIFIDHIGNSPDHIIAKELISQPLTDMAVPALKAMQMMLIMPCFEQKIGLNRFSRFVGADGHRNVEMLLLPVRHADENKVSLVGICVSPPHVGRGPKICTSETVNEQILHQNFISLGHTVDLSIIDAHTWAVLDTMGSKLTVDGSKVDGPVAYAEDSAAELKELETSSDKSEQSTILVVAKDADISSIIGRLSGRYNLMAATNMNDAKRLLINEMIDVLVTAEYLDDGGGLDLISEARQVSAYTACVFMLNAREDGEDTLIEEKGNFVQCLVGPVTDNTLMQAMDDAQTHVAQRSRGI